MGGLIASFTGYRARPALLPLLALALYWTLVWIFLRRSSGRHAPSTLVKSHGAHPVPRAGRN